MSDLSLTTFFFDAQEVRFANDKPVANDVAKALGYADPATAVYRKVSPENKGVADLATPGGIQSMTVLEEAGIYQLIFSSKLESAKRFQQWVFSEVLPSIRKTGQYSIAPKTLSEALYLAYIVQKEKEEIEAEKKMLEAERDELEKENLALTEVVDELFDYSSIIRIAKYNDVNEKQFSWRRLKAASKLLGVEVKTAPCPRYGTKNLYSHDAWRYAYPGVKMPETTTLIVS